MTGGRKGAFMELIGTEIRVADKTFYVSEVIEHHIHSQNRCLENGIMEPRDTLKLELKLVEK